MSYPPNLRPDNPANPEPEEGAPETNSQARRFAGKYANVEDLEQGYTNQFGETQRIIGERDFLAQRANALEAELRQVRQMRGNNEQPNEPAFPDALTVGEDGQVQVGALRSSIQRTVQETVQQAVAETLSPLLRGANARNQMLQMDPEYAVNEAKALTFIQQNPMKRMVYDELMGTNPLAAMQLANAEYRAAHAAELAVQAAAQTTENDRSRVQAGIVTPNAQGRAPQPDFDPKVSARMLEQAQESGDFSAFMDYRMKGMFPNWQFANAEQAWDPTQGR